MDERFNDRARKVMQLAEEEARRMGHDYLGTEHVLLGLVKEGEGVGANVLKNFDVDFPKARKQVEKIVQLGNPQTNQQPLVMTPRIKAFIEFAKEELKPLVHNYVGTEHQLLGLLRDENGIGVHALLDLGLDLNEIRKEVYSLLGHDHP
jgi:ATP-dependent Clp protease ATP-binding subunit ClpC